MSRRPYLPNARLVVDVIGYTPLEAIVAATRWGAELMRMADRFGTLEPGKQPDLVVVDGDPPRDVGILQDHARLSVMHDGRVGTRNLA